MCKDYRVVFIEKKNQPLHLLSFCLWPWPHTHTHTSTHAHNKDKTKNIRMQTNRLWKKNTNDIQQNVLVINFRWIEWSIWYWVYWKSIRVFFLFTCFWFVLVFFLWTTVYKYKTHKEKPNGRSIERDRQSECWEKKNGIRNWKVHFCSSVFFFSNSIVPDDVEIRKKI